MGTLLYREPGYLAEHQGPTQGLEDSAPEIMTTLRPLAFGALAFSSPLGMRMCARGRACIAGTQASSLGFHSAKEFVSTFQAWRAGKQGEDGGPRKCMTAPADC